MAAYTSVVGAPVPKFWAPDKVGHASVCAILTVGMALLCEAAGLPLAGSVVSAIFGTLVIGYLKEKWDESRGGTVDWGDIKADIVGAAAGALVVLATAGAVG